MFLVPAQIQLLEPRQLLSASGPEFSDPSMVAIGDLDRDGLPDVATIVPSQGPTTGGTTVSIRLYHNNGDRTQSLRQQLTVDAPAGLEGLAIAAGDLNGDGAPDLAYKLFSVTGQPTPAGEAGNERIGILLNDGKGDFSRASHSAVVELAINSKGTSVKRESSHSGIAIADVDGDGNADLANWTRTTFAVLLGNGQGNAKLSSVKSNPLYKESGREGVNPLYEGRIEAVADLDGDGAAEVIGTDGRGILTARLAKGDAGFALQTIPFPGENGPPPISRVLVGDLNADGDLDLAAVAGPNVYIGTNDGRYGGGLKRWRVAKMAIGNASELLSGDIDGDGAADLFTVGKARHEIAMNAVRNIR